MIEKIENLTVRVSNLKKAIEFYEKTLGLKKLDEWSNYATFNIGDMMLGLDPEPKAEQQIYMRVTDVDKAYSTLKEKGVKFLTEPKDQYWGGRTATFLDPDENKFILTQMKK